MKTGIYYRGKFVRLDPLQLKVGEKCYELFDEWELESPDQPDTFIVTKTDEIHHESGAIIHRHIHVPAPAKLREVLRNAKENVILPKKVRGLHAVIAELQQVETHRG